MIFKRIFNNFPVKVASLFAAALLWVIVIAGQSHTGYFPGKIPIIYTGVPVNTVYTSDVSSVQAKIITDPTTWDKLTANNFTAKVDLSGLSIGTHNLEVKITSNNDNVRIIEKNPATVLVTIEQAEIKTLPVTVKTIGQPKAGFEVSNTTSDPSQVTVTGPKSIIDNLSELDAPVLLDSTQEQNQIVQAKVRALNKQGEEIPNLTFDPSVVSVSVEFSKNSLTKTVGIQAKTSGTLPQGYILSNLSVDPTTVSITGSSDALNRIDQLSTKSFPLDSLTATTTKNIELDLPNGINLIDNSSPKVKVTATIEKADVTRTLSIPIVVSNIQNGLKVANLSNQTLEIVINGPGQIINNVSSSDFKFNIDASNKSQGNYSVLPTSSQVESAITGYSISSFSPTKITYSLVNQ